MHWYVEALRKYAEFSGRSERKEFWIFYLISLVITIALSLLDMAIGWAIADQGVLQLFYGLAVFVPTIAVAVRRLHDTDRSGLWILMVFVPFIGLIVLFIFLVLQGNEGDNRFGPDPRQAPTW